MLSIKNITYKPEGITTPILIDLSMSLKKGDFCFLVGHNGSGKSTLLKLLASGKKNPGGTITINGNPLHTIPHFSKQIRLLHQNPDDNLFGELTVLENYHLYAKGLGHHSLEHFLSILPLYHPQLLSRLNLPANYLSGGEKQALALCLILLTPPTLLLLDEHTSALDPNTAAHLMKLTAHIIQAQGLTCIAITHDLSHAYSFGNVLIALKEGRIYFQARETMKKALTYQQIMQYCYNRPPIAEAIYA